MALLELSKVDDESDDFFNKLKYRAKWEALAGMAGNPLWEANLSHLLNTALYCLIVEGALEDKANATNSENSSSEAVSLNSFQAPALKKSKMTETKWKANWNDDRWAIESSINYLKISQSLTVW